MGVCTVSTSPTGEQRLVFFCPGCQGPHAPRIAHGRETVLSVEQTQQRAGLWAWNGSLDAPTLTPSIKVTSTDDDVVNVCHSFLTDGQMHFLDDCSHAYRGQVVPLAEYTE
jgi:hypothetical protein